MSHFWSYAMDSDHFRHTTPTNCFKSREVFKKMFGSNIHPLLSCHQHSAWISLPTSMDLAGPRKRKQPMKNSWRFPTCTNCVSGLNTNRKGTHRNGEREGRTGKQIQAKHEQTLYILLYIPVLPTPPSPPQMVMEPPFPPVVGVCCVEGGTRCSKWWHNIVSVLKGRFSLPPAAGVCCVEGGTRCSKWWQNVVSVLKDKFSLPPWGGGYVVWRGETIAFVYFVCCICTCCICGCIYTCKCVCISISTWSCTWIWCP